MVEAPLETFDQLMGLGWFGERVGVVVAGDFGIGEEPEDGRRVLRADLSKDYSWGSEYGKIDNDGIGTHAVLSQVGAGANLRSTRSWNAVTISIPRA